MEGQVLWEVMILPDSDHEMQLPVGVDCEERCELTLFAFYLFIGGGGPWRTQETRSNVYKTGGQYKYRTESKQF